ncbi:MAG: Trm112 family protein [Cellvibrionales bacterium]|nr:Trm112 family protein [Cellvibrionales bacterium]
MLDKQLLALLVCPVSKAPLQLNADRTELLCRASNLAYPIRDGIPVMLESEARPLTPEERQRPKSKGGVREIGVEAPLTRGVWGVGLEGS